jgi:V8-like Glu-specific endopeptidase
MASDGSLNLENVDQNNLYKCKKVVFATLGGDEDYAIIQLDRKVVGRKPLKLRKSGVIKTSQSLFVMGHPSGLPQKYADGAKVFDHKGAFFSTNLDTFGGNSGSPVFNAENYEVEGILVRGNTDYVVRTHNGERCRRVNICDSKRENCKEWNNNIDGEQVSVIERILPYL